MTATNHALTGAAIGFIVGQPLLAIPLALLSHFVLDAIPHFKPRGAGESFMKGLKFQNYLIAEALICFVIVIALFVTDPPNWQLAAVCAFVAAAPDLISAKRYFRARAGKKYTPGRYVRFASGIQWFEKPIGGVVEVAWFIAMVIILVPFVT